MRTDVRHQRGREGQRQRQRKTDKMDAELQNWGSREASKGEGKKKREGDEEKKDGGEREGQMGERD